MPTSSPGCAGSRARSSSWASSTTSWPPPRLGREVAEALPAGRYREIPDCGHYGCLERPDTVNEAIVGFLSAPAPR